MNFQSSLFREVSVEAIREIWRKTLHKDLIWEANLLEGGLFNTTYLVEYGPEHEKAVLRLGPVNRHLLMGFEHNLMEAEVEFYRLCRQTEIPCSQVLAYDTSKQIIDRDFMIVRYIPSVVMAGAELTEHRRRELRRGMGEVLAKLHGITGEHFGFLSRICEGMAFSKWSDALIFEAEDISRRMEALGGLSEAEGAALRERFYQNRELLDQVKVPHLLHADLWEGNVLLDKDTFEITAIIDGDRAVLGDVDFEFACPWMEDPDIKSGYGPAMEQPLSPDRQKRRQLYRLFFCLLEGYVWFAEYNDRKLYETRKGDLLELTEALSH